MKKPIYKKWWFIAIAAFIIISVVAALIDGDFSEEEPKMEPVAKIEEKELSREDQIKQTIEEKVKSDYKTTSIKNIQINDDAGNGDGYIALVYLSFDAKNTAKTAKEMISMYGSDLGATLAKETDINEVTVFWEVPYLKEGDNISKLNMQRQDDGMAIIEEWNDANIFN